ncbi:MAG: VOC family protein [Candidatus Dormibacteraeota bacterium]|nr:VOC family protein [Candidatus Dormibacteraeota bacterium]
MSIRVESLAFDCVDVARVGRFWADLLGAELGADPEGYLYIAASGPRPELLFLPVPEGKGGKNRLHLDLRPTGQDQEAEVARALELGARRSDIGQGEVSWVVLADPEGNEFCILRPLPEDEPSD